MQLFEKGCKMRESLENEYEAYSEFVKDNTTYPVDKNLPKMNLPFRLVGDRR
jgi:hypothetical protein